MTNKTSDIPGAGEFNLDNLGEHLAGFVKQLGDITDQAKTAKDVLDKLHINVMEKKQVEKDGKTFSISRLAGNGILIEFSTPEQAKEFYDTQTTPA